MKALCLTVFVLLGACASSQADTEAAWGWAATVKPADPVPAECLNEPAKEPYVADKAASKKESAIVARRYVVWGRTLSQDYKRCQTWAKGQR